MEHRNLYHHSVCGRQIHSVSYAFAVIYDIVMSKHNAFRESGCSGGILHITYIVRIHAGSHSVYFFDRNLVGTLHCVVPLKASGKLKSNRYNVSQERQLFAVKRFSGNSVFKLGTKVFYNIRVV